MAESAAARAFNPLDKRNLGESVASALLSRPEGPLPPAEPFSGAGIYAIYYRGKFEAYADLAPDRPIYVGKAVPPGARTGRFGLDTAPGMALYNRLAEHGRSIDQAENIRIEDFRCRYLITDDIWIPLGESLVIQRSQPLWNVLIVGFGNHDPGSGRTGQQRPLWDELHPGRSWASLLRPAAKTAGALETLAREFLAGRPTPTVPLDEAIGEDS